MAILVVSTSGACWCCLLGWCGWCWGGGLRIGFRLLVGCSDRLVLSHSLLKKMIMSNRCRYFVS